MRAPTACPWLSGGAPGPTGLAGTELILVEESASPRLGPLQFLIEVRGGVVVLRDEQSPYGTEVSGISIGAGTGVSQIELPEGQHVLVAGGEGSPYVMVLQIPAVG